MEKKQVNIIDYLYVLVKWRKLIIINFLVVCIIAAGISLILPKWYRAETTILPPLKEGAQMGMSSIMRNLSVGGLGLGAVSEETNLFLAILNSRTVMEAVARKFDLMKRYKTKNMEEAVRTLRGHVSVKINEEGTITLGVEAGTPYFATEEEENEARELAKKMANFFVEELDRVNRDLKVEKARNTRIFIEKRYQQNLEDLHLAEDELKQFQQKYGAIALPEQTKAAITAAAELKAKIIAKEVEAGVLKRYVGSSHAELIKVQNELNELRKRYNEFKYGTEAGVGDNSGESKDLFLPFDKIPDLGLQYARLVREVTLQEKLLEFLLPQYEQAKIQEARDTPTVQVLDKAVKPLKRSKPKRMIFVLLWGTISLILGVIFAFFIEYWQRIKAERNKDYENITKMIAELKEDIRFRKRK